MACLPLIHVKFYLQILQAFAVYRHKPTIAKVASGWGIEFLTPELHGIRRAFYLDNCLP